LRELLIFPKGVLGGIGAVLVMWIAVICVHTWQLTAAIRQSGMQGPVAMAGGWTFLCRTPLVIVLLAIAFAFGFFLATRP
jgi:uncharacterized membrane protein YdjX (TVP38/TMEM64 family)